MPSVNTSKLRFLRSSMLPLFPTKPMRLSIACLLCLGLTACGGGGDDVAGQPDIAGTVPTPSVPQPQQPATPQFTISGSLTGLPAGTKLTITNNSADTLALASNGPFTFTVPVSKEGRYAVTVSSLPHHWQQCDVTDGEGTVTGDVSDVVIHCADAEAMVSTIAGTGAGTAQNGPALNVRLGSPSGIMLEPDGTIYFTDRDEHLIRKIDSDGIVSTIAGSTQGNADGIGTAAQFSRPSGIAADSLGNLLVADTLTHSIRKVTPLAEVSRLAGNGTPNWADGMGPAARFDRPYGIYSDRSGMILVADSGNHRIRQLSEDGTVVTIAGSGVQGSTDGLASNASFSFPNDVTVDRQGNILVADTLNHKVRKISVDGTVSTLAGSGLQGFVDGEGVNARFNLPYGLVVDASGYVYVADSNNNRIRKISPDGKVSTLAGGSGYSYLDGRGRDARFYYPARLVLDAQNDLLVTDQLNGRIRKLTPMR